MKHKVLGKCPICGESLKITKLTCPRCNTSITGQFQACRFCQMSDEQRNFVVTFVKCRGNIKEVERELGISYPTVRGRLEAVIQALGFSIERDKEDESEIMARREEILNSISKGELGVDEAIKLLKQG